MCRNRSSSMAKPSHRKAREIELKVATPCVEFFFPASGPAAGAASTANPVLAWSSAPSSGMKDIFCREDVTISAAAMQTVVDAAILDPVLSAEIMVKLQDLAMKKVVRACYTLTMSLRF